MKKPDFDRIAQPYRWLEYFTLGRALERCRFHFIPELTDCTHALVLGDGDGRFLARLMTHHPTLTADAVDTSAVMLRLLRDACAQADQDATDRVKTHHCDALEYVTAMHAGRYDLIVTHFFLDCVLQEQVNELIAGVTSQVSPGIIWLVSEFQIPERAMRLPAFLLVRALYLAFGLLTGLRAAHLPDYAGPLSHAGFVRTAKITSLRGMLTSELWLFSGTPVQVDDGVPASAHNCWAQCPVQHIH